MDQYLKEFEAALKGAVAKFRAELQGVRSSRPSVEALENVKVECYGQALTVQELGSLAVSPPRDIVITVWDKNAVAPLAKAIEDAKLGLSVAVQGSGGNVVRASLPLLSDERRAEIERTVRKMAEAVRIEVRMHRDETIKKLKSAQDRKELSEDQAFKGKEAAQKVVDTANGEVEALVSQKVAELAG